MKTLSITAARARLTTLDEITSREPVAIARAGDPAMIVVSPLWYAAAAEALEDLAAIRDFDDWTAAGEPARPWDEFCADMGWGPEQVTPADAQAAREILGYTQ